MNHTPDNDRLLIYIIGGCMVLAIVGAIVLLWHGKSEAAALITLVTGLLGALSGSALKNGNGARKEETHVESIGVVNTKTRPGDVVDDEGIKNPGSEEKPADGKIQRAERSP